MSVRMALAKLCACACGGAIVGGGAVMLPKTRARAPATSSDVQEARRAPHPVAASRPRRRVRQVVTTTTHDLPARGRHGRQPAPPPSRCRRAFIGSSGGGGAVMVGGIGRRLRRRRVLRRRLLRRRRRIVGRQRHRRSRRPRAAVDRSTSSSTSSGGSSTSSPAATSTSTAAVSSTASTAASSTSTTSTRRHQSNSSGNQTHRTRIERQCLSIDVRSEPVEHVIDVEQHPARPTRRPARARRAATARARRRATARRRRAGARRRLGVERLARQQRIDRIVGRPARAGPGAADGLAVRRRGRGAGRPQALRQAGRPDSPHMKGSPVEPAALSISAAPKRLLDFGHGMAGEILGELAGQPVARPPCDNACAARRASCGGATMISDSNSLASARLLEQSRRRRRRSDLLPAGGNRLRPSMLCAPRRSPLDEARPGGVGLLVAVGRIDAAPRHARRSDWDTSASPSLRRNSSLAAVGDQHDGVVGNLHGVLLVRCASGGQRRRPRAGVARPAPRRRHSRAAMHDIRLIRDNPAAFDAGLARRGLAPMAAALLALDEQRRAVITEAQAGADAPQRSVEGDRRRPRRQKDEATRAAR